MLLDVQEVYKFYHAGAEEAIALRGVSFTVVAGEFIALTGPSGSGKSSLIACIAGLDDPDGGRVLCGGAQISRVSERERIAIRARSLGLMLQGNNLVAHLTVDDNVRLAVQAGRGDRRDMMAAALMRLETWGLGTRRNFLPAELSGGERARAALAVAMACAPPLLLLDEPTGEVDAALEELIIQALLQHCAGGGAIIMATHSPALSARARRTLALRNGRLADG